MSYNKKPSRIPQYLREETVGSMTIEEVRYVDPEYIYLDKNGGVFVNKAETLDDTNRSLMRATGRVALMLIALPDASESVYIADLRMVDSAGAFFVAAGEDSPKDQEDYDDWLERRKNEEPVVAINCHNSEDNKDEQYGDEALFSRVLFLAYIVDKQREMINSPSKAVKTTAAAKTQQKTSFKPTEDN